MTRRKEARHCPACGKAMRWETRPDVVRYRDKQRTVPLAAWWCQACGEAVLEGTEAMERDRAFQELRAEVDGVLSPAQVRAAREALHLSAAQAAKLLGGGAKAFYKYERGETPPSVAMSNLLRLLMQHPDLLGELEDVRPIRARRARPPARIARAKKAGKDRVSPRSLAAQVRLRPLADRRQSRRQK